MSNRPSISRMPDKMTKVLELFDQSQQKLTPQSVHESGLTVGVHQKGRVQ